MEAADLDYSLWQDVLTEVNEHLPLLERDLHQLVRNPTSGELLASAFRHMHTIKGDFGFCQATPIMEFVHRLEGVLQTLREGRFLCSALIAEALLQSMDQVPEMMDAVTSTHRFDGKARTGLTRLIEQLALAPDQTSADEIARHILLSAHGEWMEEPIEVEVPTAVAPDAHARALALGRGLAEALALRNERWRDRAALQLSLVLKLNQQYRRPCNSEALALAVLWHDVGMLTLADRLFQQEPARKSADWPEYARHPEHAAAWLLAVAPDCTEAAQMIRQHHQWANGFGIVAPDHPSALHQGAMMLACADLLFDRVAGLEGEDYRRGVLRAVFDVNGGLDSRFDAPLINAFQAVAREFAILAR